MENELRKDYFLDRYVIIASNRGKRPEDFKSNKKDGQKNTVCAFCTGNEHLTPPEIRRSELDGKWVTRTFPNLYPATSRGKKTKTRGLLFSQPAFGRHEVIVETPEHEGSIHKLSNDHIIRILKEYQQRIKSLNKLKGVKYTLVFKNQGKAAGASLYHTHSQVVALSTVPPVIASEAKSSKKNGKCLFCRVLKKEVSSPRKVYENEFVGAFTPFASRFPFEVWIAPKRHVKGLGDLTGSELSSFAGALKYVVGRLYDGLGPTPYNFYLHVSPMGNDLHFHLEFCPKISKIAGFELGSNIFINIMPPEDAARFYRNGNI